MHAVGRARQRRSQPQTPTRVSLLAVIEGWLAARRRALGLIIAVLAVALRALYFAQLSPTPFAKLHQAPETDMHYYDGWAREIVAGDWLSRQVVVPSHRWHRDVARIYRTTHGVASLGPDDSPAEERQNASIWAGWMHLPAFYQDPLYPYMVALVYRAAGPDVRAVFLLQLLAGVASVWLVWAITCRAFDDLVAGIAAILALLCAPLLFYEMLLLRDSLLVCLSLLITWLLMLPVTRERAWGAGRLGLVIGIGVLLKSTVLLFGIVALFAMAIYRWPQRQIAIVGLGIVVGLAPLVARNVAVGVPAFTLATSGPLTLVAANDANYPPDVGFGIQAPLLTHFLADTRGTWTDALRLAVESQTVTTYTAQLWGKCVRAWHWYEIPNNENFYYAQRLAPVLTWLPLTMWGIAPVGLVGLLLAIPGLRQRWPLFAAVGVALLPLLMFYVLGRFRIALIASVIPFAAYTIAQTAHLVASARYAAAVMVLAAVALVGAWTGQPLGPHQVIIRTSDWIVPFSALYEAPIEAAASGRQFRLAAKLYADYFDRYEPSLTDERENPGVAATLAAMHRQCAELFDAAGDRTSATAHRVAADRLQNQ
jgi:dolichyl-phosphate-mannose-protein mannosyltransferase